MKMLQRSRGLSLLRSQKNHRRCPVVQTLSNIPCYSSRSNALACQQATSLKPSGSHVSFWGSQTFSGLLALAPQLPQTTVGLSLRLLMQSLFFSAFRAHICILCCSTLQAMMFSLIFEVNAYLYLWAKYNRFP